MKSSAPILIVKLDRCAGSLVFLRNTETYPKHKLVNKIPQLRNNEVSLGTKMYLRQLT